MFGHTEIIIIAIVALLLFGASSIPKLARSIGQARREFEKGLDSNSNKSSDTVIDNQKNTSKKK